MVLSIGYASKLSKYMNKMEAEDRARQEREWQQDMDFNDFSFRLNQRYTNDRGQHCRDYVFRRVATHIVMAHIQFVMNAKGSVKLIAAIASLLSVE